MTPGNGMDADLFFAKERRKQKADAAAVLDLFKPPPAPVVLPRADELSSSDGWAETWAKYSKEERLAQKLRWRQRLMPLLQEMLCAVPIGHGVTAAELQDEAMKPDLCTGFGVILPPVPESDTRIYSFIGPWLTQLARKGTLRARMLQIQGGGEVPATRKADRDEAHSNGGIIYLDGESSSNSARAV